MQFKYGGALFSVVFILTTFVLGQSAAPPQSNLSAPAAAVDSGTLAAAPATAAPRAPRFVPVLFSATDPKGSPVLGLTKDQITILDSNSVVQPLQLYKGRICRCISGLFCSARHARFLSSRRRPSTSSTRSFVRVSTKRL